VIVIVDYGMGNLASVANMFRKGGAQPTISSDPTAIAAATKLVLPGVGAFGKGMEHLRERGLIEPLNDAVLNRRVPVIGLCLGMQLMTRHSEEGQTAGLGWIDAETVRFRFDPPSSLKVPHMGWNHMRLLRDIPLVSGLDDESRFYFVHSYYVNCANPGDTLGVTTYGREFTSAISRENIMGVQFHPEKSHKFGLQLLRNFATMDCGSKAAA
jgi:glutamine amidotransferase